MRTNSKIPWHLSIRNRVLIFSILVTLLPSSGMGWFFYSMSHKSVAEKAQQKLIDSANKVERDIYFWLKDRKQDFQVFASSFVIVDNLAKIKTVKENANTQDRENQIAFSVKKIATYLNLVRNQFSDYRKLAVFDADGNEIAASESPGSDESLALPNAWQDSIASTNSIIGDAFLKNGESLPLMMIGIPINSDKGGRQLGVLAVEIRLQGLLPLLTNVVADGNPLTPWNVDLIQKNGLSLLTTASAGGQQKPILSFQQKLDLFANPLQLRIFDNGAWAVGLASAFKELPWGLVLSENYENVFADVIRSRDKIIPIAVLISLVLGLFASLVVGQIILPLKTLTHGVKQVADGELDVSLEVKRNDELGVVTEMFNEMAIRLKDSQGKLEKLAITDSLTGIANRKQIMTSLKGHIEYFRRYGSEFSLLMIDVDHFKDVNDTHGHLVGDMVLIQIAEIFKTMLRTLDNAGRYGGEEFLIILGQTNTENALRTAERIRKAVEQHLFVTHDNELHITISVGMTGIFCSDDVDSTLIGRADKALYEAKARGRNRVIFRDGISSEPAPEKFLTSL